MFFSKSLTTTSLLCLLLLAVTAAAQDDRDSKYLRSFERELKTWWGGNQPMSIAKDRDFSGEIMGIASGSDAAKGEFPFMVSLEYENGTFACGGSLISATRVLTAAHCFFPCEGFDPEFYSTVRVNHVGKTDGEQVAIDCVTIHPDYIDGVSTCPQTGLFNDLAIIKLASAVTSTTSYMSLSSDSAAVGTSVTAIGFGLTEAGGDTSDSLQKLTTEIISLDDCGDTYPCLGDEFHTCAQIDPGNVCPGDSGGPLFVTDGTGAVSQVGLVSYGVAECGSGFPDVYTNVAQYKTWIEEQLASTECTTEFDPAGDAPCDDCVFAFTLPSVARAVGSVAHFFGY